RLRCGASFRGCGHSLLYFRFRPPCWLALPVAPTAGAVPGQPGGQGFDVGAHSGAVAGSGSRPANRPNRATDGVGTCTPPDPQPCRLLPRNRSFEGAEPFGVLYDNSGGPSATSPSPHTGCASSGDTSSGRFAAGGRRAATAISPAPFPGPACSPG